MFFRSMALTVEQFPPDLQTKAKLKVLQAISELETEHQQRFMVDNGFRSDSSYSFTPHQDGSNTNQSGPSSAASYYQAFSPQDTQTSPDCNLPFFENL